MIANSQEYLQIWEKQNNPLYPNEMVWDRVVVNRFLADYEKQKIRIDLKALVAKPIIRNDQMYEWMNKMTDEELAEYNRNLPTETSSATARHIDDDILYTMFKTAQ